MAFLSYTSDSRRPKDEKAIETVIEIAQRWGANAILGQLSENNAIRLRKIGIPIILQNYTNRVKGISNITGDYYSTGEIAASYFLRKGFTNFAFYGTSATIWSREREDGFRTKLAAVGQKVYTYNEEKIYDTVQPPICKPYKLGYNNCPVQLPYSLVMTYSHFE